MQKCLDWVDHREKRKKGGFVERRGEKRDVEGGQSGGHHSVEKPIPFP